ncbi:hypothetical protein [Actinomyces sp. W5033]|uniref:hypothetical protein n=1 Tax=Actinomyces sp. W5033 TaxID=3446479 RepID=UPI003EDEBED4
MYRIVSTRLTGKAALIVRIRTTIGISLLALALGPGGGAGAAAWVLTSPSETVSDTTETTDTQVVHSLELAQDVTLLSLKVTGLMSRSGGAGPTSASGPSPGTKETVHIKYSFDAQVGFDGFEVTIEQTGESAYTITVPSFRFLSYSDPSFETLFVDGEVLSGISPGIDQVQMVNDIFSGDAKDQHVADNTDLLKLQCETFCNNIVHAIDPGIQAQRLHTWRRRRAGNGHGRLRRSGTGVHAADMTPSARPDASGTRRTPRVSGGRVECDPGHVRGVDIESDEHVNGSGVEPVTTEQ